MVCPAVRLDQLSVNVDLYERARHNEERIQPNSPALYLSGPTVELDIAIPSRLDAYAEFQQLVLALLVDLDWDGRDLFSVEMALEEGMSNAIRHGNKFDETKQIAVRCELSPERFRVSVQDEGDGFSPNKVSDCTSARNLRLPDGRGLALIKAYMTDVHFNDRGNCVTMEKVRRRNGRRDFGGDAIS